MVGTKWGVGESKVAVIPHEVSWIKIDFNGILLSKMLSFIPNLMASLDKVMDF